MHVRPFDCGRDRLLKQCEFLDLLSDNISDLFNQGLMLKQPSEAISDLATNLSTFEYLTSDRFGYSNGNTYEEVAHNLGRRPEQAICGR